MKALRIILIILTALGVTGLLCYQGFVTKNLEVGNIIKGGLILAGLILALVSNEKRRKKVLNKKAQYQKAYGEFIQNAFYDDPKLEKKLYKAIDAYNQNKPSAALEKLGKLRSECRRTAELYAVTFFTAMCLHEMGLYEKAIEQYSSAMQMRPHSTISSNLGLCYERSGQIELAVKAYHQAVQLNPKNEFVYNNLGALRFREGNYQEALQYAESALEVNARMPQALSLAAVCCALLKDTAKYEDYYRRAVSAGYDGSKIKSMIRSLDTAL